jgi:CheY-like chemotaxis protein
LEGKFAELYNECISLLNQKGKCLSGAIGKAIDSGCDDYISKPTISAALLDLINKYVLDRNL